MQLITKSKEIDKRILDLDTTQTTIAKDLGISSSTVNKYLK